MAVFSATARQFRRLLADESGGSFVDYAIIITLVSMGVGFATPEIGAFIGRLFGQMNMGLDAVVWEQWQ